MGYSANNPFVSLNTSSAKASANQSFQPTPASTIGKQSSGGLQEGDSAGKVASPTMKGIKKKAKNISLQGTSTSPGQSTTGDISGSGSAATGAPKISQNSTFNRNKQLLTMAHNLAKNDGNRNFKYTGKRLQEYFNMLLQNGVDPETGSKANPGTPTSSVQNPTASMFNVNSLSDKALFNKRLQNLTMQENIRQKQAAQMNGY